MFHPHPSDEVKEYLNETKLHGDEELKNRCLRIQKWLKALLSPVMVNAINNLEGEKAIYDFIKRNLPFLNENVVKTQAKKAHNFVLEQLMYI